MDKIVNENEGDKVYAMLAYLWLLCFIPLIFKKEDRFVMFHAKQGLVLFVYTLILWLINFIPFIGPVLGFMGFIVWGIVVIVSIIHVMMGRSWKIPFISEFASKISI